MQKQWLLYLLWQPCNSTGSPLSHFNFQISSYILCWEHVRTACRPVQYLDPLGSQSCFFNVCRNKALFGLFSSMWHTFLFRFFELFNYIVQRRRKTENSFKSFWYEHCFVLFFISQIFLMHLLTMWNPFPFLVHKVSSFHRCCVFAKSSLLLTDNINCIK